MALAFAGASRVSTREGLQLSFGSAIELAGLHLSSVERTLYNSVRRELKSERIQGLQPYARPVLPERKASTPATFEQRRAWASKSMLLPRMGGAGAMLRYYKSACGMAHPLRQGRRPLP